jgi:alpha-amylase
MGKVKLLLGIHSHQPVGNFDYVFEWAYQSCYLPFIEVIKDYPDIPLTLHYSGPLIDWIEGHHPEFFEKLTEMVKNGNIEFMGGGYYEPILPMIPEWDRIGQMKMMADYIQKRFSAVTRGIWLTERVWEQCLVSSIGKVGAEYTVVDDSHFKLAGIKESDQFGYYITEDQGHLIKMFCSSEYLRYSIPFAEVETLINFLLGLKDKEGVDLIAYGDDGEKFGVWPGTNEHVYKKGWLRKFFDALRENKDAIEVLTFSKAIDKIPPKGKIYIPNASYREMTEWALFVDERAKYEEIVGRFKDTEDWNLIEHFLKGGFWRNFIVKYPESRDMYGRMMQVSKRLRNLRKKVKKIGDAEKRLYMAQCNCPYWHGVFGGLYLNHLRFATYKNLIESDYIIEKSTHRRDNWLYIKNEDFDLDGNDEVLISNEKIKMFIKPNEGGMVYEMDILNKGLNVLDTMTRRIEYYHRDVAEAHKIREDEHKSIHLLKSAKEEGLGKDLIYDWYRRKSFIDHFFLPDINLEALMKNTYWDKGSFVKGEFDYLFQKSRKEISVSLGENGVIYGDDKNRKFFLKKIFRLFKNSSTIKVEYFLRNDDDSEIKLFFGSELNFALLTGDAEDRFYQYDSTKRKLGDAFEINDISEIGIEDQWIGVRFDLKFNKPARLFAFPIKTISQSESGFEKVYQSSAVIPMWWIDLKGGESNSFEIVMDVIEK